MAQIVALLALLKKLLSEELSSFSSVGLNNFLFCLLFLMIGDTGKLSNAFWSTLFFQLVLLAPLFVTFSIDTQRRWPPERVATWPISRTQRLLLSSISFVLNPLFIVLFFGYLFWMGFATALFFLLIAVSVHCVVYAIGRVSPAYERPAFLRTPRIPLTLGGVARQMARDLTATLDFWAALVVAISGTLYRLLAQPPEREALPILSLFVAIAMSTIGQRMLSLDDGRAALRYRLLPIEGWKLLLTLDAVFLVVLGILVSPLDLRTGLAFGFVSLAAGRYPSLHQRVNQRRWRFVGGDLRFGIAQVLLGCVAGIAAARHGLWVLAIAAAVYLISVFWGELLWKRS